MTVCIRCHRPLKRATETGMGPVCARAGRAVPVPAHERDLFGYDIEKAVHAALYRLQVIVEGLAAEAQIALADKVRAARARVWAP